MTEESYPYKTANGDCQLDKKAIRYNIAGWAGLKMKDENKMLIWLAKRGPISVGLNAKAMMSYLGGISNPGSVLCPDSLNHAALIVGYGLDSTTQGKHLPYWSIKNSWGTRWGEQGYYRLYRGNNTCGVASDPTTAIMSRAGKLRGIIIGEK